MWKSVMYSRKRRRSQLGFTLVEFAVALAIGVLLIAGAAAIMKYAVVQTAANSDRTMAQLQTQYVSFWISQDVMQAQQIHFGNSTGTGFPLTITCGSGTVTYNVVNNPNIGMNPWQLTRTEGSATSLVAEYLNPTLTKCYREIEGNESYNVLVLDVAARVDQSAGNSTFEVSPRYSGITWD
jgi:prepilin-type N-terminal cleavage/methylation domain-containing protein